mgnify:CR=1 FL=1
MNIQHLKQIILLLITVGLVLISVSAVSAAFPLPYTFNPALPTDKDFDTREAFITDIQNGAAVYTYNLKLSPGTNSLEPVVRLSYSSHGSKSKHDILGDGWTLSQSYIQRDVNATRDEPNNDFFILVLNGASHKLIPDSQEQDRYHTQVETFTHIQKYNDSSSNQKGDYWIVRTPEGTSYRLGFTSESETVGSRSNLVWRWNLDLVQDTHNNSIFYTYQENPFPADNGTAYLMNISYNNDQRRVIEFGYETSNRPDLTKSLFDNGNEITYSRRLEEVRVKTDDTLVRKYVLAYASDYTGMNNARSLLKSITEHGSDGSSLPATSFGYYTADETPVFSTDYSQTPECHDSTSQGCFVSAGGNDRAIRAVDVNNDGFVDLILASSVMDPSVSPKTWLYNGTDWEENASWDVPQCETSQGYIGCIIDSGNDNGIRFIDVNGDNLVDVVKAESTIKTWLNNGNGWNQTSDTEWEFTPCTDMDNPGCFLAGDGSDNGIATVDVNGDGLVDFVKARAGAIPYTWLNTGRGWVRNDTWRFPECINQLEDNYYGCFVNSGGNDLGMRYADVNGDGLVDFVKATELLRRTWINTGSGWQNLGIWTVPDCESLPGTTEACFLDHVTSNDNGIRLGDINGDGLVDLVKARDGTAKTWLNKGNGWQNFNTWKIPNCDAGSHENCFIDNNPNPFTPNGVYFVDFSGDGIPDLIKTHEDISNSYSKAYVNNAERVMLLRNITTSFGATIDINYTTLSYFENDLKNHVSGVGLPLWVVTKTQQDNGISGLQNVHVNNSYTYTKGFFDYLENDFRGFGFATENKTNNITIKHSFYQDVGRQGQTYKTQTFDTDSSLFQQQDFTWNTTTNSDNVHTTLLLEENESTIDGTSGNPKTTKVEYVYDQYGNAVVKNSLGDLAISGDEKYEYSNFVYNITAWIVNTQSIYTLYDSANVTKLRETQYSYDDQSFGSSPVRGDVTKKENVLEGGSNSIITYEYDLYGNVINVTDPAGKTTLYTFGIKDITFTFPDQETNHKGHVKEASYDLGTGNILSVIDANGFVTNYTYDVFSRIKKEILPLDTVSQPTQEYTYTFDGTAPETIKIEQREQNATGNTFDTYQYHDGFGEVSQKKSEAEGTFLNSKQVVENAYRDESYRVEAADNKYIVSADSQYASPDGSINQTLFTYDPLHRVTVVRNPDETLKRTGYELWNETQVDEQGNVKVIVRDAYTNIIEVKEYNAGEEYVTQYEYDDTDQLTKISDNEGNQFQFFYDTLGRQTSIVDPDLGIINYTYDAVGNLLTTTDERGITITSTYDDLHRVLTKIVSNQTFTYIYDQELNNTLSSVGTTDFARNYSYDPRLRLIREQKTVDNFTFVVKAEYDSANRITSTELEEYETITYAYTDQSLLDSISGIISSTDHNEADSPTKREYSNSLTTDFSYNLRNFRLERIQTSTVQNMTYLYDNTSNVLGIEDVTNNRIYTMTYDALSRLIAAVRQDGVTTAFNFTYTYSSIGNVMNLSSDDKGLTFTYNATIAHAPHHLSYRQGKPLSIESLSQIGVNGSVRVFEIQVLNNQNVTLSDVNWTLDTGLENVTATESITLDGLEDMFVFIEYNYTSTGEFNVTALVQSGTLSDVEVTNVTI